MLIARLDYQWQVLVPSTLCSKSIRNHEITEADYHACEHRLRQVWIDSSKRLSKSLWYSIANVSPFHAVFC
jgi:hypothetical protein